MRIPISRRNIRKENYFIFLFIFIFFSVTVAPETVRMLGNDGTRLDNYTILGPMHEGSHVELICEANHGRPTPKVTWYNGTHEMKGKTTLFFFMRFFLFSFFLILY